MRHGTIRWALVAVLLVAGCGKVGDDDAPKVDPAAWARDADGRCTAANERMKALGLASVDDALRPGDGSGKRKALIEKRVGYVEVGELEAPDGRRDQIKRFADAAVEYVDDIAAASRAIEAGDAVSERTDRDRATSARDRARAAAKGLGLTTCIP